MAVHGEGKAHEIQWWEAMERGKKKL